MHNIYLDGSKHMQADDLTSVSLEALIAADNWQAKYRLITDWGKLITVKPHIRVEENLVKGCETNAWLAHDYINDQHIFLFDSDSRVINGLAVLLLSQINNHPSAKVMELNIESLLQQAGLQKHLTPSRNNGFKRILERARELVNLSTDPALPIVRE